MEADISIWQKPGRFYFALTGADKRAVYSVSIGPQANRVRSASSTPGQSRYRTIAQNYAFVGS
jgi:hypothetical protein